MRCSGQACWGGLVSARAPCHSQGSWLSTRGAWPLQDPQGPLVSLAPAPVSSPLARLAPRGQRNAQQPRRLGLAVQHLLLGGGRACPHAAPGLRHHLQVQQARRPERHVALCGGGRWEAVAGSSRDNTGGDEQAAGLRTSDNRQPLAQQAGHCPGHACRQAGTCKCMCTCPATSAGPSPDSSRKRWLRGSRSASCSSRRAAATSECVPHRVVSRPLILRP